MKLSKISWIIIISYIEFNGFELKLLYFAERLIYKYVDIVIEGCIFGFK